MVKLIDYRNGKWGVEVNGTLLRRPILPSIGKSVVRNVGSDSYAHKIKEIAPDYTWFVLENNAVAVLVTRKNSKRCGCYVCGFIDTDGKYKPRPTPYRTCISYDTYWIVDYEAKDELDPSF